jgi:uncharacterized repeat protein (TIGR01451 family)
VVLLVAALIAGLLPASSFATSRGQTAAQSRVAASPAAAGSPFAVTSTLSPASMESPSVTPTEPTVTCTSDPNIFNTGYDAATGGILGPNGTDDAEWQVSQGVQDVGGTTPVTATSLPGSSVAFEPAVVGNDAPQLAGSTGNDYWASSPYDNAQWISQKYVAPSGGVDGVNDTQTGDFYYEYQFNLDPAVDPSSFSLSIDYLADNTVSQVWVNGVSQSSQTTGLPENASNPYFFQGYLFANAAKTTLNHDWQTGTNTIVVEIKSAPNDEGFLAQVRPSALCPVNLAVTKTASPNPYVPGEKLTYTVTATNSGPGPANGTTVADPLPSALSGGGFTWTCTASSGSACGAPSGSGSINDTANIASGGKLTYTVTGTVPASASGTIANTATVTPPTGTVDSGCSPDCTATASDPQANLSVSIQKFAAVSPAADQSAVKVGDTIAYSYLVTNTGDADLTTISVNDPSAGAVSCPTPASPGLAPNASETCTAELTHTVTQADVDAGSVADTATASGADAAGTQTPTSSPSTATVPAVPAKPSLMIQKQADASDGDTSALKVGETVQYSYTVTNTGNVDVTAISVSDPTAGSVDCDSLPAAGLAPGASVSCHAAALYKVTQSDVDAGHLIDTATASGTSPNGGKVTSSPAQVELNSAPAPAVSIQKTAKVTPATDQDAVKVGDQIAYSYVVTNIGNVTLKSVSVSDPSAGATTCQALPSGGLAPGASVDCAASVSHTVTQSDVDAGSVTDTATAKGVDKQGVASPTSDPSTATVTAVGPVITDSIAKSATVSPAADQNAVKVGDTITYAYTVTNTGNVDQIAVSVVDPTLGPVNCPTPAAPGLAPGASETCTSASPYTVTQADVDAGKVVDTATATASGPGGEPGTPVTSAPVTVSATGAAPAVSIQKTGAVAPAADQGGFQLGDTVSYAYKVTNTGNVTLTSVAVRDPTVGPVTCPTPLSPGLAPGASEVCRADAQTVITQADVDAGSLADTATATGTDTQGGVSPTSAPSTVTLPAVTAAPGLTMTKVANAPDEANGDQSATSPGDVIDYFYYLTNTGNVTLNSIAVSDPNLASGPPSTGPTCPAATLAPDQSETCTGTYTVPASTNGTVTDTATASAAGPSGQPVSATSSVTVHNITASPAVAVQKSAAITPSGDSNDIQVGDMVQYSYVVTNIGNVDLTTVSVNDPSAGTVTCPTPASPGLAPGATETCTASNPVTVTQAEVDANRITDTATATGVGTTGGPSPVSAPSTATLYGQPSPQVTLLKSAAVTPASDQGAAKVGDTITYSYKVTNTGNVDLPTVTVSDPSLGPVSCPTPASPGLAPGNSETCTATHTVTQADVDAGSVVDEATATASDPLGATSPPASSGVTVTAVAPDPMVSLKKVAAVTPAADQTAVKVGDTIQYSYVVTNTGNVDLPYVQVSDPTLGPVTCPTPAKPGLAPGASLTCTANETYTVTQSDLDNGGATDHATAIGLDPAKGLVTPTASASTTTPSDPQPSVSLKKMATVDPKADQSHVKLGDKITYTFKVTNTGNVDLQSVAVSDPSLGDVSCPTFAAPGLAPGASTTCIGEVVHIVSAKDIKAGKIANTATATGTAAALGAAVNDPHLTSPAVKASLTTKLVKPKATPKPKPKPAKLKLTEQADPKVVKNGGDVHYTLKLRNVGKSTADKVKLCTAIPAGTTLVKAPGAHLINGEVCWTFKTLRAGHGVTKRFVLKMAASTLSGKVVNHSTATATKVSKVKASATVKVLPGVGPKPEGVTG